MRALDARGGEFDFLLTVWKDALEEQERGQRGWVRRSSRFEGRMGEERVEKKVERRMKKKEREERERRRKKSTPLTLLANF